LLNPPSPATPYAWNGMAHAFKILSHIKRQYMYRLILGILLASFHVTLAQSTFDSLVNKDSYIINAKTYNKGIYRTFER
jgi:hypothetical protein